MDDELVLEEAKLKNLSEILSHKLERLQELTENPEMTGVKTPRQVQHLEFRTKKINEQNAIEEALQFELRDKIQKMQLLGRCIIREEISLQKSRALKNQEVNDLVQRMGGDPNEPQIVKEKRLGQLTGLWSIFDWEKKQGITMYD